MEHKLLVPPRAITQVRHKLGLWRTLSRASQLLLAEAIVLLALAQLAVKLFPFRVVARWLDESPASTSPQVSDPQFPRRVRQAVETAARNVPWKAVCLPQAVAAKAMLSRRGYAAAVHFGVGKDGSGTLIAHAWVEVDNRIVVGEQGIAAVAPLARFGGRASVRAE